jgi:hypothetical protein
MMLSMPSTISRTVRVTRAIQASGEAIHSMASLYPIAVAAEYDGAPSFQVSPGVPAAAR